MPRKPRIEYSGAFYHVITRGNQKQKIFKDQSDYQKYLLTLTTYKNRTGCRIYAFVLMSNHVHLLIETSDIPLSKFMQGLSQTYTMHFNRKYRTSGHLFQGRFKAILCDRETYLLGLLKYVHQNPLRAKIAGRLDAYPWSSHHAYTGRNNPLGLVEIDQVLRLFSENKGRARRKYREFMDDRDSMDRNTVYATIDQRLQGDESFVEEVQKRSEKRIEPGKLNRVHSLQKIAKAVDAVTHVDLQELRSETRQSRVTSARRLVSALGVQYGYKRNEIARYLKKDPAAVSHYLREKTDQADRIRQALRVLEVE